MPASGGSGGLAADRLVEQADRELKSGNLVKALEHLDAAAGIHQRLGDRTAQARCLQLAAMTARLSGSLDVARRRAEKALQCAPPHSVVAVQAAAEAGEIAMAADHVATAVAAYGKAVELMIGVRDVPDALRGGIHRRRGMALAVGGAMADAVQELTEAARFYSNSDDGVAARRALVEAATIATNGHVSGAAETRLYARRAASSAVDQVALADLDLLDAAVAVEAAEWVAAQRLIEQARQRALDAVAPTQYLAASIGLSELQDRIGDRQASYGALATAWATLGDLVGRQTADELVRPRLESLLSAWGREQFAEAKAGYEASRRRHLGIG